MSFGWPLALLALVAVPLAVAGYVLLERRREAAVAQSVNAALLPNLVGRGPGWRRHVPPAILLLAVAVFLLGFARPHATRSVRSEEATAVIAIDSSRSMGATDLPPTRLAVAQAAARRFVQTLPDSYRVAVVAFGSEAQVVSPPTRDREFVDGALTGLRVGEATAIGDAVDTAVKVARSTESTVDQERPDRPPPAVVLVLSDGAVDGGRVQPDEAVGRARRAGVPVFTALLGTDDGVVEVKHPGGYVERIQVPPDPDLMREVANGTGGRFLASTRPADLKAVSASLSSRLGDVRKDEEITNAFAAAGAALLLLAGLLSVVWLRRSP